MRSYKIALFVLIAVCMVAGVLFFSTCGRRGAPDASSTTPSTTQQSKPESQQPQQSLPAANGTTPTATTSAKLGFHTTKAKGEQKCIVVLTNFPDVKRQYPEKMLSDRITNFLGPYFQAASYDKLRLKVDVSKPIILPNPVSYYKIAPRNVEVDRSKIVAIVTDAANAADSDVNFNDYNYVILALGATQVEYGMVGLCPIPGMLGFEVDSVTNKSGEVIHNAAIFGENAHLGTYAHDTLHMLGGRIGEQRVTPCLYDHNLQAKYPFMPDFAKAMINMGFWDPLSSHAPYK